MKKYLIALSLLLMLFAIIGCGSSTSNPLMKAKLQTDDVLSGSGANIGTYAYIKISKDDLEGITFEEYKEFIEERVSSDYNWVSIICTDGTGIVFPGGDATLSYYGKFDADDTMGEVYGYIGMPDGTYQSGSGMEAMNPNFTWLK